MRGFLFAVGLALVGFGLTILFGAPQSVLAEFAYWQEAGVVTIAAGILLTLASGVAWIRHRKSAIAQNAATANLTRGDLDASIARILSQVQMREQWKANAVNYGDDVRAHAHAAELAALRAQLAEANSRLQALPSGPRTGLRLTVVQTQDRLTFTNDTGETVAVGEVSGEGGLDLSTRISPPFVLPMNGSFFVNLHRILGRTEHPAVVIKWTDSQGDEHVQRIGV